MTKHECRMSNVERMTKPKTRKTRGRFVIRHLFIPSSFVIRASAFILADRRSLIALTALTSASSLFAETPVAPVTADWHQDAPGVRHKITLADLPAPYATKSASNSPREVRRPAGAELRVPAGFK